MSSSAVLRKTIGFDSGGFVSTTFVPASERAVHTLIVKAAVPDLTCRND